MSFKMLNGSYTDKTWYNITIKKAVSEYVFDENDKRFLDLRSGLWNCSLGYIDEIYDPIQKSFNEILNNRNTYNDINSFNNALYVDVSKSILELLGFNTYKNVLFTNSGSESTELALKIANYISNNKTRNKILSFKNSYHGTFNSGMAVSGIDIKLNENFSSNNDVDFIDFPLNSTQENNILKKIDSIAENYSVMIIEPVLASAGIYYASNHFFESLLRILKNHNVISIFDEVATGFFRTGSCFYETKLKNKPNIVCLSKNINNGITPFGCVCVDSLVNSKLSKVNISMEHFSTQNGNILGFSSSNIVLNYYLNNYKTIKNKVNKLENIIKKNFDSESIDFRNIGLMVAIPVKDSINLLDVINKLKDLGILVYMYENDNEHGITLMPNYECNPEKLDKALKMIIKLVKINYL